MNKSQFKPYPVESRIEAEKLFFSGKSTVEIHKLLDIPVDRIRRWVKKKEHLIQKEENILLISDLHSPYHHTDALRFLKELNDKYSFDRIVILGDELDYHALSFHDSDPDLDSAGKELQSARHVMWELEATFPRADLLHSNHGSLAYRRAHASGIPKNLMLSYRDAIFSERLPDGSLCGERGKGWNWHNSLTIETKRGKIRCVHGMSTSTRRNVEMSGMSFVQGHHHSIFELVYHNNGDELNWGMTIGCLIDDKSLAFAYNKNTIKRPVIGCGALINGYPRLLPLQLDKDNRWTGFMP